MTQPDQPERLTSQMPPRLVRLMTRTVLGQIMNGLPDLAAGTLAAMHPDDASRIADTAMSLHLIAAEHTPEGKQAAADYAARTPTDGQAYNDAQLFLCAWRGDLDKLNRLVQACGTQRLLALRGIVGAMSAAIEREIPRTTGPAHE